MPPWDGEGGRAYNDKSQLVKEKLSIGTEYTYEYNSDNLLSKYTNGRGEETVYEYDKLGRITSLTDELGTISYTYDGNGNILTVSETGKDGNTNTITRTYDSMNRVTSYTDYKGDTVKYSYDELGNLISLTYAGGEIVRYKYYENGALKEVIDSENLVTSYTYDKRGNLLTTSNPDGTSEVNTYDDLGQLSSRMLLSAAGEELYSYSYTYDDWGNITSISYSDSMSSDEQYQGETDILTSASMTYDSSNRMIMYNGEDIEYDADGNMTYGPLGDEMVHFTYDCRNRLIRAGDIEYTYDAEDIRISTSTSEYTEEYTTDSVTSLSRVLEIERTYKNNSGKNLEHEVYYYGNGLSYEKLYDNQENPSDNGILVYHYDHLGSTKILTDRDGEVKARFSYGTYGELLTTEYFDDSDVSVKFLYNGQLGVITDDSGLYYMRARYYNPDIKRFINQDILTGNIGNSASLNRYSYVQGNPLSYTDPFGLEPFSYFTDKVRPSAIAHTVLDVLGCLPGGSAFDLMNAALYAAEGNYKEAVKCLVFSIPGMDLGGKAAKYMMKGTKAGKVLGTTLNVVDKTGKALAIGISAHDFGNQVAFMIDKYMVNGEDVSWDTAYEVLALGASGFQLSQFTKMGLSSFDTPRKPSSADASGTTKYGVVEDSQIENIANRKAVDYDDLPGGDKFSSASDKGGFSSGGCFIAGTKVKTPEGEKNIEDIKAGDEVYAYNPDTEETDVKKVLQTFVHESSEIAHVTIDGETIDATINHPFYVVGYGFIPAGELKAGDIILLLDGTTKEVESVSIEYLEQPVKVYNFEVEDWHTYYVSEQGVLVHNQCYTTEVPKGGSKSTEIVPYYPENNGAIRGTEEFIYLKEGEIIDRYGKVTGKYFSPVGTPIEMRALPYDADLSKYHQYEVVKPFEVEASTIAPAFDNIGLGTQYRSPVSVEVLLKRGIIKEVGGN
ncbi:MAG: glycohydrolase toxin TNT-related protein [Lachnospiraceae bacterium]|nr:glycohydrolase toxin TNT-related protein [Lachnospiraceae bacterium]